MVAIKNIDAETRTIIYIDHSGWFFEWNVLLTPTFSHCSDIEEKKNVSCDSYSFSDIYRKNTIVEFYAYTKIQVHMKVKWCRVVFFWFPLSTVVKYMCLLYDTRIWEIWGFNFESYHSLKPLVNQFLSYNHKYGIWKIWYRYRINLALKCDSLSLSATVTCSSQ